MPVRRGCPNERNGPGGRPLARGLRHRDWIRLRLPRTSADPCILIPLSAELPPQPVLATSSAARAGTNSLTCPLATKVRLGRVILELQFSGSDGQSLVDQRSAALCAGHKAKIIGSGRPCEVPARRRGVSLIWRMDFLLVAMARLEGQVIWGTHRLGFFIATDHRRRIRCPRGQYSGYFPLPTEHRPQSRGGRAIHLWWAWR